MSGKSLRWKTLPRETPGPVRDGSQPEPKQVKTYPGRTYKISQAVPPRDGTYFLGWCTQGRNGQKYPSANIYLWDKAKGGYRMRDFPEYGLITPDIWGLLPAFEVKSWPGKR